MEQIQQNGKKLIVPIALLIAVASCFAIIVGYAFIPAYNFITDTASPDLYFREYVLQPGLELNPVLLGKPIALLLIFLPKFIGLYVIFLAIILLQSYWNGDIFTVKTSNRLEWAGWAIAAITVTETFARPLAVLLLTGFTSPGGTYGSPLNLGWGIYLALIVAILLIAIGKIFREANIIAEENKSIV